MQEQYDLFDATGAQHAVRPAPTPAPLAALAAALPRNVRLGTSSWSFPGWRGLVWAEAETQPRLAARGLEAYAAQPWLRAVGVDRSYYAAPAADYWQACAASVPADFRFLVKAPAAALSPRTPAGRPNPLYLAGGWLRDAFLGPLVEGLADRLGVVVLQFPPQGRSTTRAPERFAADLARLLVGLREAAAAGPRLAVELRDAALLTEAYRDALAAADTLHCFAIHPRMPPPDLQCAVVGAPDDRGLCLRWSLAAGLDYATAKERFAPFAELQAPDAASRAAIVRLVRSALAAGGDTIVTVNNKAEGSAPRSVIALAEAILGEALRAADLSGG